MCLYCLFNVCILDFFLCVCLMQCSYSSTSQNDSETPEGITLELMDRLLKKREGFKDVRQTGEDVCLEKNVTKGNVQ